jgi:hypothetical protein
MLELSFPQPPKAGQDGLTERPRTSPSRVGAGAFWCPAADWAMAPSRSNLRLATTRPPSGAAAEHPRESRHRWSAPHLLLVARLGPLRIPASNEPACAFAPNPRRLAPPLWDDRASLCGNRHSGLMPGGPPPASCRATSPGKSKLSILGLSLGRMRGRL